MKKDIISILICPECQSSLKLEATDQSDDRIHQGNLFCNKCSNVFEVIDDIICFKQITQKNKSQKKIQKIQNMFLKQEFKKEWLKNFTGEEKWVLEREWKWMIDNLNLIESKIHLDWATGTGRFLRNVLEIIKGEIIALEIDYPTCLGLKDFLKKIDKYSRVSIIYGNAQNMPLADSSIESVSSWHGLNEPNISKALSESKRVLKENRSLAVIGLFYKEESESLRVALKERIEFAVKGKAQQYFKELGFKDIKYKTFFKGKWSEEKSFLPKLGDYYTVYGISGEK